MWTSFSVKVASGTRGPGGSGGGGGGLGASVGRSQCLPQPGAGPRSAWSLLLFSLQRVPAQQLDRPSAHWHVRRRLVPHVDGGHLPRLVRGPRAQGRRHSGAAASCLPLPVAVSVAVVRLKRGAAVGRAPGDEARKPRRVCRRYEANPASSAAAWHECARLLVQRRYTGVGRHTGVKLRGVRGRAAATPLLLR